MNYLHFLLFQLVLLNQCLAEFSLKKITLAEFDRIENDYMSKMIKDTLKNGSPTKEYSQELADIAQKEANRLAEIQKLEFPLTDLSTKKYYGFSKEMIGKLQTNNSNIF